MDVPRRAHAVLLRAAEQDWNTLANATTRVHNLLWAGISPRGDPIGAPSHPRGRWGHHRRQETHARALMALIQEGITRGCQRSVMIWCALAADAILRFDDLCGDCWIFRDVRLGGVPPNYLVTLTELNRVLKGRPGDRSEVARLLSRLLTADPLLVETVTRLLIATPPAVSAGKPTAPTTVMIEAVGRLDGLTRDQLAIAHDLATTWHNGPATLAVEVKIRSPG